MKYTCQFIRNEGFSDIKVVGWEGKQLLNLQFNQMAHLGLITMKDVVLVSQRSLMSFQTINQYFVFQEDIILFGISCNDCNHCMLQIMI